MFSTLRTKATWSLAAIVAICSTISAAGLPTQAAPKGKGESSTPVLPWKATWEEALQEALDRNVPICIEWHKDF
jgi:hypothetical protein